MVRRRIGFKLLIAFLVLVGVAFASSTLWLPWFGYALIRDDGPAKADIAVVPAGDIYGHRIERAAQLVKQGYVPQVLVSGPINYDTHECDLAIAMMVHKGYPESYFIPFPNATLSTREEAIAILGELRRRGIHNFVLVTSSYHTKRAAQLYRAALGSSGSPSFRVIAAQDEHFRPQDWWRNREGEKTVIIEWLKTVATALGK